MSREPDAITRDALLSEVDAQRAEIRELRTEIERLRATIAYDKQKLYSDGFLAGYAQAIGDADVALKSQGDDEPTRLSRRKVLALANVAFNPNEVAPVPDWSCYPIHRAALEPKP